jgi:5-methylcytosine-specific restriction endonuclease McrA
MNLFHRYQRHPFYGSLGWRKARYMTLKRHGRQCACCRRTPEQHRVALHVDHIVPRSKDRRKELTLSNLQVLCEDCNLGKGNTDRINWHGQQLLLFGS